MVILGCGFIGTRLARAALAEGRQVRVCARGVARLEPLRALGAEVHYMDAGKPKQFGPALSGTSGATVVYAIPPVTELPAGEAVRRAGQAAINAGARRFIYLSSSGQYGMKPADDELIDETRTIALDDPGMVHFHSEESAVQALAATGMTALTLRLAVVYGPGRGVRSRLTKGDYQLIDDGAHYISRVHVDDVVGAILAAEKRAEGGALYLVADDKPTTQREVAEWLVARLGLPMPRSVPLYAAGAPSRQHRGRRLDNALIKKELGLVLRYPTYVEGEQAIEREEGGEVAPPPAPVVAAAPAPARPPFIKHIDEVPDGGDWSYPASDEKFPAGKDFADALGLTHIGLGTVRLRPGERSAWPHAHSGEDEFCWVLEGTPDVWLDGVLHRLRPGDLVGFPAGTAISHVLLNDSDKDATVLMVGERKRPGDKIFYPLNPERHTQIAPERFWADHPKHELGPHDGKPKKR